VFYHLWNHPKLHFLLKPRKTADRVKVRDQENLHLALLLTSGHAEAQVLDGNQPTGKMFE
jgi:hypothetical protein